MAQYPTAAGTDANLFVAVNNLSTSLTDNPLTSGATTVNVASTTGFPTTGYITIEAEAIQYTGVTGTSFTGCTRGADGTAAASHVTALQVYHNIVAAHRNVIKDEIKAIEGDLVTAQEGQGTVAINIARKLNKTGGTMSGAIAMGTNKVTGLAAASANGDAVRWEQILGFRILQMVTAVGGASISTTSTSFVTSNATLSITPSATTSKILVIATSNIQTGTSTPSAVTIARGGTNLGDATSGLGSQGASPTGNSNEYITCVTVWHLDSPATTSATTYALYFRSGVSGQAVYCPPPANTTANPDLGSTRIIAFEIG